MCLAILSSPVAYAHDFWIRASDYHPEPEQRVELSLHVGQDFAGELLPRIDAWIVRFDYQDGSGIRPVAGELGDDPAGFIAPLVATTSVVYQSHRQVAALDAGKFHRYLAEEGLEWVIAERKRRGEQDQAVREWFSRYAKAIIQPQGDRGDAWRFDFGMPLELTPLRNPYDGAAEPLPLRLSFRGDPLPDVQVVAYSEDKDAPRLSARTDAEGRVRLAIPQRGLWLIKAVHMVRAPEGVPTHQWESFWASLTLAR